MIDLILAMVVNLNAEVKELLAPWPILY